MLISVVHGNCWVGLMHTWEAPKFEEIDMNAEIGGYQPDTPDERGDSPRFVQPSTQADS